MLAVSLVVIFFLFHWRSALIILIQMPISIAVAFILLNAFHISSNIMSLTGIVLAIGVIVDDSIVMVGTFGGWLQNFRNKNLNQSTTKELEKCRRKLNN
jgi:Cu/Ag efflux pump CusA